MKTIKVCFISLRSYPLFSKNSLAYFGGAEVQISLIAKALARDKHFAVSLICGDYRQPPLIKKDNLTIYKTKLWDFWFILKKIDADILVERTINPKIPIVWLWCKIFRRKFVYMIAHDWDLTNPLLKFPSLVICQSRAQQSKCGGIFLPPLIKIPPLKYKIRRFILWVGRADPWKRPREFIALASRYPQEKFVMICRPGRVRLPSVLPANLRLLQTVPFNAISRFFATAKILVNTSVAEGWPNTFLQAGAAGTPVLSFRVNPDSYLEKYHCGLVGKKLPESSVAVLGRNHYTYVKKHHGSSNIRILKQILYRLNA